MTKKYERAVSKPHTTAICNQTRTIKMQKNLRRKRIGKFFIFVHDIATPPPR